MIAAEAQSLGKPVIATNTTGLREIVSNGTSGILLDDWTASGFADAIGRLKRMRSEDPQSWTSMQERAKQNHERSMSESARDEQFEHLVALLESCASLPRAHRKSLSQAEL